MCLVVVVCMKEVILFLVFVTFFFFFSVSLALYNSSSMSMSVRRLVAASRFQILNSRALSTDPVLAQVGNCFNLKVDVQCNFIIFIMCAFYFDYLSLLQVYGGLKDQDRIFTNLYGEKVSGCCAFFFTGRCNFVYFAIITKGLAS